MSTAPTYPGVYIQELPSPVHTITGVATSIAAFVGYTARGVDNRAQAIYSFSDFERLYGGLASNSEVSYAVQQFYLNGGSQAYVVRTPMRYPAPGAGVAPYASVTVGTAANNALTFTALSSGTWANGTLLIDVDVQGLDLSAATGDPLAFNLTVTSLADGAREVFAGVTLDSTEQNYVVAVVNDFDNGSQLVKVAATLPAAPAVPAPLTVSGLLGTALAITGAGGVNALLGGGGTTVAADSYVTMAIPGVTGSPFTLKVFSAGAPLPQTVQGLASQLQQALNNLLSVSIPGAVAVASAAPVGSGSGIRLNLSIPNKPDTLVTFTAPGNGADASTALGLAASTTSNPAHFALGTGNNGRGIQIASVAASAPTGLPGTNELVGDAQLFTGIYALAKVDLFNLLCIPEAARAMSGNPDTPDPSINATTIYTQAIALCDRRRAMLLIDPPPNVNSVSAAVDWKSNTLGVVDANGAAFFPRLRLADALNKSNLRTFAPSGVVAGVYAGTDSTRGVWKAPAGIGATLNGVQGMTYTLSDPENGTLNPLGLNCFRTFPLYGPVLWGARTLVGADAQTNQWKYVPVRRTALFIEESLYRGTKWVVFEPNDAPLWAAIRLNVGAFMQSLFLKGAFQGTTPSQAYFVKCDSETTTQNDIDQGIVNILVGFAPLKPAEFVVIQIEQLTGQAGS